MHSLYDMFFFFFFEARASTISLGAMEVVKQVSDTDKWKMKKYMGLPGVQLNLMVTKISKFPTNFPT